MIVTRNITDMYMVVLASLSNSDKLDLIAKLSNSMREGADGSACGLICAPVSRAIGVTSMQTA